MAFVTYKLENGWRRVEAVYRTQAEAAAAAAGNILAFTGSVSNDVEPGRYINAAGSLQSGIPSPVQVAAEEIGWQARIREAYLQGYQAEPLWRWETGLDTDVTARSAGTRYRYHQAALAWVISDKTVFGGFNRSTRNNTVEHIVKEIRKPVFRRFLDASKTTRDAWNAIATSDGQEIRSDLITPTGVARSQLDGVTNAVPGATIPTKFGNTLEGE